MANRMPGFTANVALSGRGVMHCRLEPMGAVVHQEVLPMLWSRNGGGGVGLKQCFTDCVDGCDPANNQCIKDCGRTCNAGAGVPFNPPGQGTSFRFKDPLAGNACCIGLFSACAVACPEAVLFALLCEGACIVGAAACVNGQVWPCNLL